MDRINCNIIHLLNKEIELLIKIKFNNANTACNLTISCIKLNPFLSTNLAGNSIFYRYHGRKSQVPEISLYRKL